MDLDDLAWLLSDDGQLLLAEATALVDAEPDPLRAQTALRRTTVPGATPDRTSLALSQAGLRRRAEAKLGALAARMYFTPDALEQATRLSVARHRAARLRAFEAGTVIDLGCGIGGDLVAAAETGALVAGVDLDPVRVALARANLDALGLPGAVQVADATTVDTSPFDVAFADPARRSARGRSFSVDDWTPPWRFVEGLLRRDACVKVAPGIPHELVPDDVEAEWVSDHGEVKEAALWSGRLATVRRRATVLGDGGLATLTEEDDPGAAAVGVRPVGRYLHEPDGAVIRAGLVTAVAAATGGGLLDPHLAYTTSDEAPATPFARGYEVLEELPYREKPLRAALRERGIGRLEIKKRGVDVVPEQLRKRLALSGDTEGTLVLTRVAGEGTALLVRPLR
ncbi:class I SAM-dependent methyltransferase [Nocardioides sp. GY 10127]|uniref:class I SAM-dependent methyltransferase n=1 Tax=Nocardioides sp. GY 10127 TaxID=2569762 RepID=UPI0010A81E94|nr:class I SAM-dependent methyltransferase [Nocardioides sp. GY 10127]TIC84351.1 class I SAM-dependent methyltransferase [Nocardioides sp. GY 10127]